MFRYENMFAGIQVSRPHTNYQRILWRKNENEPKLYFRLFTVSYGLALSPFLAVRVLKQLADDHRLEYPAASRAKSQDAYMDDIHTGCDSVDDLLVLKTELIGLFGKSKTKLRKWSSNFWHLLQSLGEENRCYDPVPSVKVIGIQWNPGRDVMFIKPTAFDLSILPTKRLLTIVKASLTIPVNNTICWTDSEIVLHSLLAPPRNWNTYVCNRTAEILSEHPRSC